MRSGINLSHASVSLTNKILIGLMVIGWIALSANPSVSCLMFNPKTVLDGHFYSMLTYPLIEPGLISIVFQGLMLAFIGTPFEAELGRNKYIKLLLATTLAGSIFGLLISPIAGGFYLKSMYSFILTLFLLHAYKSPDSEVYFFFVIKMKMITMIYISLSIMLLLAIFQGQASIWATLFSITVGFSYVKGFKKLGFLIPKNKTTHKIQTSLGLKKKSNLKVVRNNGDNFKTKKSNVIQIKKPKGPPKT